MAHVVHAVLESFTWAGLGLGALAVVVALIVYLADGSWVPTRAVVEDLDGHRAVRWFDEAGGVNEAVLSPDDEKRLRGRDMADIYYRVGQRNRMRLTPGSPATRTVTGLAVGLLGLGVLSAALSLLLLVVEG